MVADIQELVKGGPSPRGVNRIVILSPALKPVRTIEYTTERPLFCDGNRLFVYGDLAVGNIGPEGNVLSFSKAGAVVKVSHTEASQYPIPITRDRPNLDQ